jgi:exopolysaccharide biosynthesis polyprenyl glycosylphosphotransferase
MANSAGGIALPLKQVTFEGDTSIRRRTEVRSGAARSLRLRHVEHKVLIALGDLLLVNLALACMLLLRERFDPMVVPENLGWFALLSMLWTIFALSFDCYDIHRVASPFRSATGASWAALLAAAAFLFIPILSPVLPTRRSILVSLPGLSVLWVFSWRYLYARMLQGTDSKRRVIIVGAGWAGRTLLNALVVSAEDDNIKRNGLCYEVVGFVDDDPAKQNAVIDGVPVLGTHAELGRLVEQSQPDDIVMAINRTEQVPQSLVDGLVSCRGVGVDVSTMASFYERLTGRVPVEHAGRALEVVLPVWQADSHQLYVVLKRLIDIVVGFFGCLALLAVIPFVWLVNKLVNPGDLFFTQTRVGLGGKLFKIVKFRSMVMNAERDTGAVWATKDDKRIPPFGGFLRKSRLDELPQCWNVLRGDMTIVGPRPERPEFVEKLSKSIRFYCARHAVKPGITGWAQIKYRYGASEEDALMKLQYDLYYIRHQGAFEDAFIILKTMRVMLAFKGR